MLKQSVVLTWVIYSADVCVGMHGKFLEVTQESEAHRVLYHRHSSALQSPYCHNALGE